MHGCADVEHPDGVVADAARFDARGIEARRLRTEGRRRAHVDAHAPVVLDRRLDDAAERLDADRAPVGEAVIEHEAREAAGAVAALLDLGAVGVEDPVAEVDPFARRRLDEQDLVGADAEMAIGDAPPLLAPEAQRLANAVDDDEVVARAVHLREAKLRRIHRPIIADRGRRTGRARRAGAS